MVCESPAFVVGAVKDILRWQVALSRSAAQDQAIVGQLFAPGRGFDLPVVSRPATGAQARSAQPREQIAWSNEKHTRPRSATRRR